MATEDTETARYFTVDEANAFVPELSSLFGTIMLLRAQLKTIFQRLEALGHAPSESAPSLGAFGADTTDESDDDEQEDDAGEADGNDDSDEANDDLQADIARDRMVFHGMAETLREYVERVLATGCVVKDIEIGLVDWLGRHDGRDVWLCWKYGERNVGFWHDYSSGFSSRRPVSELQPTPHR
jgi:hypothetical protein